MKIVITGSNGQLGQAIFKHQNLHSAQYIFIDKTELDITQPDAVNRFFQQEHPEVLINAAAYTQVDHAETDSTATYLVNAEAVGYLAKACAQHHTKMIHISTDFVFDGKQSSPYKETDFPRPINIYGASKLEGEKICLQLHPEAIIIRTSWLYAAKGQNFINTILRLATEREHIKVVSDQAGTPTLADDLAKALLNICFHPNFKNTSGLFHYSNHGICSWYDFALEIIDLSKKKCNVIPIETSDYPTAALRPTYSVLNKTKITQTFSLAIPHWKHSLQLCLNEMK